MELNIGIAGVGNFARFAAKAFLKIPGINIIAVTDRDEAVVKQIACEWNVTGYVQYDTFLEDKRIDLVYIATPPWLHYPQARKALIKGKHVICEKPAALETNDAIELALLAKSLSLLWVVNLMQRYNPMYDIVKKIVDERIIGNFLHGFFENYASDENIGTAHWFWDESKSGSIFIEHGVHFFDMFAGWLGEGKLLYACQLLRAEQEKNIIDRVQATVLYDYGIVNFYHGFDQPAILDRQEMRLQFEHGEITLYEWVPVKMRLHGLLKKEQMKRLHEIIGDFSIVNEQTSMDNRNVRGRSQDIIFDTHTTLEYADAYGKEKRYETLLSNMLQDQWNWINDRNHNRVIDEYNAVNSLRMAATANEAAKNYNARNEQSYHYNA